MNKWIKKFSILLSLFLLLSPFRMNIYGNDYDASNETFKFGINAINTSVKQGQSMLLTPAYGDTVVAKNNNYSWCKVAVFDWSEKEDAYVLVSLDTTLGDNMNKKAVIPPNGFALVACPTFDSKYSNTVSNYVFEHINSLTI